MFDYTINELFATNNSRSYRIWDSNRNIYRREWYRDGKRHKLQLWFDNGNISWEEWYRDGKWHRVNGPAVLRWLDNGVLHYHSHWVYGVEIAEKIKEWANTVGIT